MSDWHKRVSLWYWHSIGGRHELLVVKTECEAVAQLERQNVMLQTSASCRKLLKVYIRCLQLRSLDTG